jgi:hypothetical protein
MLLRAPDQAFVRLDTATGQSQMWAPGPRCFCEELVFVPGPEGATKEDDGALLGMVFDAETQRSSLVVRTCAHMPSQCAHMPSLGAPCWLCAHARAHALTWLAKKAMVYCFSSAHA